MCAVVSFQPFCKLEQLECLRSQNTPATPWLPILLIHNRSQFKTRWSQSHRFKKSAKNSGCKYEMDPASIVEDTEWTRFCPQMDWGTDRQMDRQCETRITPFQLCWSGIIIITRFQPCLYGDQEQTKFRYKNIVIKTSRPLIFGMITMASKEAFASLIDGLM